MSRFLPIFEKVIRLEGGYILHDIPGDKGGMTYAGIARNAWPHWRGWTKVDRREFDSELKGMVQVFYKKNFWDAMSCDEIKSSVAAYHIFAFGVNTGRTVAKRIAQQILGVTIDGFFGPQTLAAINSKVVSEMDEELFELRYTLLKILRYKNIAYRDKRREQDIVFSDLKFLIGWINRAEKGLNFKEVKNF